MAALRRIETVRDKMASRDPIADRHPVSEVFTARPGILTVALLFASPVFAGGRAERAIRALFVLSFVLAVPAFVGLALVGHDLVAFEVTVLTITWIVLIASGVLLGVVFGRPRRMVLLIS